MLACSIQHARVMQRQQAKFSTDRLDMLAGGGTYQRFDLFNNLYNPMGNTMLRTIFLKTSNCMQATPKP